MSLGWYSLLAILLCVWNLASLACNLFLLPGNWMILAATAIFAWLVQGPHGAGVAGGMLIALTILALVGEIAEFAAGAAGAAKFGGSRRGIALSMVGAMAGSLLGVGIGLPIPIVGPVVAAVIGGALGAFTGAYVGEHWKGRSHDESLAIGHGAMLGRLGGTAAKLIVGVIMFVLATWDSIF